MKAVSSLHKGTGMGIVHAVSYACVCTKFYQVLFWWSNDHHPRVLSGSLLLLWIIFFTRASGVTLEAVGVSGSEVSLSLEELNISCLCTGLGGVLNILCGVTGSGLNEACLTLDT